jgi:hypothetical protein
MSLCLMHCGSLTRFGASTGADFGYGYGYGDEGGDAGAFSSDGGEGSYYDEYGYYGEPRPDSNGPCVVCWSRGHCPPFRDRITTRTLLT